MVRHRKRAFSIVEILVCVAIIAVMAAVTYPVAVAAKKRSRDVTCASNLRSLWLATALYREDYSPHSEAGNLYEMGMPSYSTVWQIQVAKNLQCPLRPSKPARMGNYVYNTGDPEYPQVSNDWIAAVEKHGPSTVIFADFLHGDQDTLTIPTYPHLGLGVDLGGTFRKQNKPGKIGTISEIAAWFLGSP